MLTKSKFQNLIYKYVQELISKLAHLYVQTGMVNKNIQSVNVNIPYSLLVNAGSGGPF